ncbi:hypothetical protein LCGC14_2926430, partial [marine sediment metagenome]
MVGAGIAVVIFLAMLLIAVLLPVRRVKHDPRLWRHGLHYHLSDEPPDPEPREYRGRIDDIRVYDTDLSMDQIILWMNGGYPTFNKAMRPYPMNAATDVPLNVVLDWVPGENVGDVNGHDVYFGTTSPGVFQGNQAAVTFDTGTMLADTTYYWRIDEVNDTHPNSPWKGDVWSFTIPPKTAYDPDPADGIKFVDPEVEL